MKRFHAVTVTRHKSEICNRHEKSDTKVTLVTVTNEDSTVTKLLQSIDYFQRYAHFIG